MKIVIISKPEGGEVKMGNGISGQAYSVKDLLKAFDMGIEYGICVLENSL